MIIQFKRFENRKCAKMKEKKLKLWKKVLILFLAIIVLGLGAVFGISEYVVAATEEQMICSVETKENQISQETLDELQEKGADCILVLGASVKPDGSPSHMLKDRLDTGILLYKKGIAPKLLLSGDHGQIHYDEVNAMKTYAAEAGVPIDDIFLDHAGFSTYESVYRAKEIFQAERLIVVTQGYHQPRALYGCNKMGVKAWGAASDQATYRGQAMRDLREIAARDKDFVKWMFKPEPTYLGEAIPISGSGIKSQE